MDHCAATRHGFKYDDHCYTTIIILGQMYPFVVRDRWRKQRRSDCIRSRRIHSCVSVSLYFVSYSIESFDLPMGFCILLFYSRDIPGAILFHPFRNRIQPYPASIKRNHILTTRAHNPGFRSSWAIWQVLIRVTNSRKHDIYININMAKQSWVLSFEP